MKIIIAGAGTAGYQLAKELVSENKDVVIIERNEELAKFVSDNIDCMVINGNVNDIKVLEDAGIASGDFFISMTDSDELNILACSIVHNEFGNTYNIARVRNKSYYDTKLIKSKGLGIDFVVNPEIESAKRIAKLIQFGVSSDMVFFEKSNIQMRRLLVTARSRLIDKPLYEIRKLIGIDFLIAGFIRDDEFIIASGNTILKENDQIYILSSTEKLDKIFGLIAGEKSSINNIIIVGGGVVGRYVLDMLNEKTNSTFLKYFKRPYMPGQKKFIRLIEKDQELSKKLAEKYSDIIVINEDITDENIFEEEQLGKCDLIITVTENSELNVLMSIYSKAYGIKKAIALVKKKNYLSIASKLGIDALISPNNSIVNSILKHIRKGKIKSVHTLSSTDTEVIEMTIEKTSPIANKKIKDIPLPKDSLILVINRVSKSYIPDGEFEIHPKDDIILITRKKNLQEIERLFIS